MCAGAGGADVLHCRWVKEGGRGAREIVQLEVVRSHCVQCVQRLRSAATGLVRTSPSEYTMTGAPHTSIAPDMTQRERVGLS